MSASTSSRATLDRVISATAGVYVALRGLGKGNWFRGPALGGLEWKGMAVSAGGLTFPEQRPRAGPEPGGTRRRASKSCYAADSVAVAGTSPPAPASAGARLPGMSSA
ncbi:MAG: hypothetical protein ACRDM7_12555, partial [Thermoleophilaceae bacterium]